MRNKKIGTKDKEERENQFYKQEGNLLTRVKRICNSSEGETLWKVMSKI